MLAFALVAAGLACGGERPALGATRGGAAGDAQAPEPRFVAVSAGATSTCALTDRGRAYCWGSDSAGQLGTGATGPSSSTPVAVRGSAFTAITVGQDHACGLSGDGVAYCWGSNEQGALGTGQRALVNPTPTPIAGRARFQSIDAGTTRTCAVTLQGAVYCWGRFSVPSADPAGRSASVPTPVASSIRFRTVSVGLAHACGRGADSGVYCWGLNHFGELGRGPPGASHSNQSPGSPTLTATVVSVGVSATGSCAVTADGVAYCWGRNMFGELGNGTSTEQYTANPVPSRVVGSQRWRQVSTGGGYTCGLTVEGEVKCWGLNAPNVFLLGSDSTPDMCVGPPPRPCTTKPIPVAGGLRFSNVSAGGTHTCGVTSDGQIFCWGTNDYGELGTGSTEPAVHPSRVVFGPALAPASSERSLGQPESTPIGTPVAVAPSVRKLISRALLPDSPPPIPHPIGVHERKPKIALFLTGAAELLVADPHGRRTGFDPSDRRSYGEIPDAVYGIDAGTFRAQLNDAPITSSFHPVPGHGEVVVLTLQRGANRLDLSVRAQGTTGTDRDRLTFIVQ